MSTELERVMEGVGKRLKELKARYPRLAAWLVFALGADQVDLFSDVPTILATFPGVFDASVHRRAAEALAKRIADADRRLADLTQAERRKQQQYMAFRLATLEAKLTISPNVLVELRFETLEYALIDELRQDSLVDRERTPQTRASIRIVLGTARELGALDRGDTT